MNSEYPFLSISKINQFFKDNSASPRKKWGQNFLIDPNTISFIVQKLNLKPESTVAEIGSGLGALTYSIYPIIKTYHVFEIDPVFIQELKKNFTNLIIHEGDVLKNLSILSETNLTLVGNLPYYISTDIILLALNSLPNLEYCIFMLQKEFAERLCNSISSLALYSICFGEFKYLKTVSSNCFYPKPEATSALIEFIPNTKNYYSTQQKKKFETFLRSVFWGKRKTIHKSLLKSPFLEEKERINYITLLQNLNFNLEKRPEELDKKDYIKILENL
jgi:16S rRNA (adenine1518-N6/adenine1519-N6)-dimethyltransferase